MGEFLTSDVVQQFKPVAETRHRPRVSIDRLVVHQVAPPGIDLVLIWW